MIEPDDRLILTLATISFFAIASLTYFFSSRPRLFIRIFVPADEFRGAMRGILRDPNFRRGMRNIAALQAAVATAIALVAAWCWLV